MVSIIMIVVIDVIDVIGEIILSRPPGGGVKIVADDTTGITSITGRPIGADLRFAIWVRRGGRFRPFGGLSESISEALYFSDPTKQGIFPGGCSSDGHLTSVVPTGYTNPVPNQGVHLL